MTTATAAPPRHLSADVQRTPPIRWLAVVSVMLGIFSIVTSEILPIGLLTPIGASFRISAGTAGLMMTLPGLLAAVAAPVLTVATGRLDRRVVLVALMVLLAVSDVLAALATSFWVMLLARVLVGLVIGGFWSVAAGLAARLVPAASVGRATAVIFAAVPLGSVLGVPAGTFLGGLAGWRAAFVALAVLTAGVLVALLVTVPPLPAGRVTRLRVLGGLLRRPGTRAALAVTALTVVAHFGTYTYVTPFLRGTTHLEPALLGMFLLGYGAAGIAGTFGGGWAVRRAPRATFAGSAGLIAVATLLLPVLGRSAGGALALLLVWGLAYGAVPVSSQAWFARAATDAPEAGSVLFTSSFQATFAGGAVLGGMVVDAASAPAVMLCGGAVAVLAALVAVLAGGRSRV